MRAWPIVGAALVSSFSAVAAAPPKASPLPFLPSVPRVHIDVAKSHVVVIEEINLPRGTWRSGDLDFFVALGSPGMPLAFDAHLLAVPDGALEPSPDEMGDAVATERASRRPASAHPLLGRSQMSGNVIHVREAAFRKALAPGNMAALRLRTVLHLPAVDARGGREVVVRLGIDGADPLTVGRLQLTSAEPTPFVRSAEAHLCGNEADPYPLSISLASPKGPLPRPPDTIAPVLAVRHASDDLCVRFTTY